MKVCSTAEETEEGLGEIHHHIIGNDVSRIVFRLETTTSLNIVALIALNADAPIHGHVKIGKHLLCAVDMQSCVM